MQSFPGPGSVPSRAAGPPAPPFPQGTPTAPRLSRGTVPFCPNNTASTNNFPDEDTARETEINVNTAKRAGF